MLTPHPGIAIRNLSFGIGDFAFLSVNLAVAAGTYVVLSGANGCGKSVLLKLITGIYTPKSGSIAIRGIEVTSLPPWMRNIGYVPQDGTLFPHRSVAANVAFGLEVRKIKRGDRDRKVGRMLELLNITHLAGRLPTGLSGGERQRVSLARALVFEPSLLLLDEPVSAIDEGSRDDLCRELRRIQQEIGVTTLHVSHNSRESELVADGIARFCEGKIELRRGSKF